MAIVETNELARHEGFLARLPIKRLQEERNLMQARATRNHYSHSSQDTPAQFMDLIADQIIEAETSIKTLDTFIPILEVRAKSFGEEEYLRTVDTFRTLSVLITEIRGGERLSGLYIHHPDSGA